MQITRTGTKKYAITGLNLVAGTNAVIHGLSLTKTAMFQVRTSDGKAIEMQVTNELPNQFSVFSPVAISNVTVVVV
jgi:hypothetical protein